MTRLLPLLLAACTFVPPPKAKDIDGDGDGVLAVEDCNDQSRTVFRLEPVGVLHCGDVVEETVEDWNYSLMNCLDPVRDDRLIRTSGPDATWRFASEEPTAVTVWVERDGVAANQWLFAINGPQCTTDACEVGNQASDSVDFYAAANEPWFVVVATDEEASGDYTLHVHCDGAL